MIQKLFAALTLALSLFTASVAAASAPTEPTADEKAYIAQMQALQASLHPKAGAVAIPGVHVTLNLGETYYFLNAEESRRVLIEAWGNPPESVNDVIGMIFPAGKTFTDDTWGAVLTYVEDGYVSDADAAKIDYAALLDQLREGETQENEARRAAGFGTTHLVGWAQQPSYDPQRHNLIWAKEISFSDSTSGNTLNYDVRVLGRRGVFSMNLVTGMDQLEPTRAAATQLMGTAAFDAGSRYTDYVEGQDKKAAYGVAGLIAGGAAVALAKKAGLLGVLFLILKKGGVFLLAGAGAAFAWLRNLFNGKKGGEFRGASARVAPAPVDAEPDPGLAPVKQDDAPAPDDRDRL